jgi:hypothetical protein
VTDSDERDIKFAVFLHEAVNSVFTEDEGREILHVAATSLSAVAEPAGRRILKGFDEPTHVHSLLLEQQ